MGGTGCGERRRAHGGGTSGQRVRSFRQLAKWDEAYMKAQKVSKQNMEKMSLAYDLHKEKQAELAKAAKKSSGTKRKGDTPKKSPGKKKKAT